MPWRTDLLIQAANCLKETGDYSAASSLYRRAALDPKETPEATRQLQAVAELARVRASESAAQEGERRRDTSLNAGGLPRRRRASIILDQPVTPATILGRITSSPQGTQLDLGALDRARHVPVADLDPVTGRRLENAPTLSIIQAGSLTFENYGYGEPMMMGVAAVRIKIMTRDPVPVITVSLDDALVAQEAPVLVSRYPDGRYLYIANIWIDCDRCLPGSQVLTVRAMPQRGVILVQSCAVTVVRTPPSFALPESDTFVPSPLTGQPDLVAEVCGRPATIRSADAAMIPRDIGSVLAMRVDQLGDVSSSLPALRRLRETFPAAHLVALVPPALAAVIEASGLVDEVLELTLEYSKISERRYIDAEERELFGRRIAGRSFDLAIDLCPAHETRRLLLLTNAKYLVGFSPLSFPFLDFGIEVTSRDKANRRSVHSHAATILALVESLYLAAEADVAPVPRVAESADLLEGYKLAPGGYVVIHSGARHAINRWPLERFLELADRLAGQLDILVVFFADTVLDEAQLAALRHREKIMVMEKLSANAFDAILSNARAMIGNDSGPKHLAAVRGVWTASIHVNRLNWREWGQVGRGLILTKKTPCGGCELNDERLCGRNVACVRTISVDEVAEAVLEGIAKDEQPR
jgi:ADP-heptose:LPS heptosyltransferase